MLNRFLLTASILVSCGVLEAQDTINLSGQWKGVLELPEQKLPLIFVIDEPANGKTTGYLLSPAQTQAKIPLSGVMRDERRVVFDVELVGGEFKGTLYPKSESISGKWKQGGFTLDLDLEKSDEPFAVKRPQNPKGNPSYRVETVSFPNRFGPHELSGTLTIPEGSIRKVPAVVLVSGSGPHDRDATMFGHKSFWVLADYLTRKGIAVLRYDDRGVGESGGVFAHANTLDFATDAWAGVEYLKSREEIDPAKIGLLGHSEGGLAAPVAVSKRDDVAFLVLLAAPGVTGDQTILSQSKAIGEAIGLPEEFIELNQKFSVALFSAYSQEVPDLERIGELGKQFEVEAKKISSLDPGQLEGLGETMLGHLSDLESPWLGYFLRHDPGPMLEKVSCPVLVLQGELDLQVLPDVHLPEIENHLKAGGNTRFEIVRFPGMNHLFQRAETGAPSEYGLIEETIAPAVLKSITEWIQKETQ